FARGDAAVADLMQVRAHRAAVAGAVLRRAHDASGEERGARDQRKHAPHSELSQPDRTPTAWSSCPQFAHGRRDENCCTPSKHTVWPLLLKTSVHSHVIS